MQRTSDHLLGDVVVARLEQLQGLLVAQQSNRGGEEWQRVWKAGC